MEKLMGGAFVAVVLAVLGLIGFTVAQSFVAEQTRVCTVEDKDRASKASGGSSMRLYTEECGTIEVGDMTLRGQFDSADIYADIEPGTTYEVTTVGHRVPFLSMFPTVLGTPEEVK